MKIPDSVIYIVGDVLGTWYYSHTKLDTLFGGTGFPGQPPSGNCVQKCQEWMRRANSTPNINPRDLLGGVLAEFMNLDLQNVPKWRDGFKRVTDVLAKNGLAFELNGIVELAPNNTITASTTLAPKPSEAAPRPMLTRPFQVSTSSSHPIQGQTKTTVLFLAANPDGVKKLALDEEARSIRTKIRASDHPRDLDLHAEWALRPDDLLQYLNEYRPHIVHFSGHGSASEQLILHDQNGRAKPVTKAALVALFKALQDNIRVVVLNACFSRPQAEAIVDVIDCAVGMNKALGDDAAIVFAASFYRALGFGRSVLAAFEQGRAALLLEGIPEENTPELLVRKDVDAGQIFLVGKTPNPK